MSITADCQGHVMGPDHENAHMQETFLMSNSGDVPLQVPAFGEIPLDYELPLENRFAHGHLEWEQVPGVTNREMVMVAAMNFITEKRDWFVDIFEDAIAESWRREVEAAPTGLREGEWYVPRSPLLLSQKAWEWCLLELRDKAAEFAQKQFVRVLDTGSCVCKSDTIVPTSLASMLKANLTNFYRQPRNKVLTLENDGTLDVVDPYLYPLVYGKTPVLQNGHALHLPPILDEYSKTKLAPKHEQVLGVPHEAKHRSDRDQATFSWNFQCLPCEVEFVGQRGWRVRIASYINNLHPKHASMYTALENILPSCISMWNECVVRGISDSAITDRDNDQRQRGRIPLRIVAYGVVTNIAVPDWAIHFDGEKNEYKKAVDEYLEARKLLDNSPGDANAASQDKIQKAKNIIETWRWKVKHGTSAPTESVPSPTPEQWHMAQEFLESPELGGHALPADWMSNAYDHFLSRVRAAAKWDYPEPGNPVSYADWHAGKDTHRAVVAKLPTPRNFNEHYSPSDAFHECYSIQLEEQFREKGLQIIVRIGGIEASPGQPPASAKAIDEDFEPNGEPWQISGRLNEHIVATAIYVYDVANVQEPHIEFRQCSPVNMNCYPCSNSPPAGQLKEQFWTSDENDDVTLSLLNIPHSAFCSTCNMCGVPAFQNVGRVAMREGRLFAFPNIMEHRFTPLQLLDDTLPGHCRFVTFQLVDPHYRICSTRNVPPQQHDWWREEVDDLLSRKGLPQEIIDSICGAADHWPMSEAEAFQYRQDQLRERDKMNVERVIGTETF